MSTQLEAVSGNHDPQLVSEKIPAFVKFDKKTVQFCRFNNYFNFKKHMTRDANDTRRMKFIKITQHLNQLIGTVNIRKYKASINNTPAALKNFQYKNTL